MDFYSFKNQCARMVVIDFAHHTSFAKIIPDRSKKVPVGTIKGISNYFTFMWPSGDKDGYIAAYEIPNYGKSKKIFNF